MGETSPGVKKFYLASGFNWRYNFRALTRKLNDLGHEVVSEWIWIDERTDRADPSFNEFAKKISASNLIDLHRANALILDTRGIRDDGNGGAHSELGFALGRDYPIYLIGPKRNTFNWAEGIMYFEDGYQLLDWLKHE